MIDDSFFGFCIGLMLAISLITAWLNFFIQIGKLFWKLRYFITFAAVLYYGSKLLVWLFS